MFMWQCRGNQRLTNINDHSVEQVAQAITAKLLKKYRSIEDDGVNSLLSTCNMKLQQDFFHNRKKEHTASPDSKDMHEPIT